MKIVLTDYPLLTLEATEFLEKYLTKDMNILEYGSGSSTIWFSKYVKHIISVEDEIVWYNAVMKRIKKAEITNITYKLLNREKYRNIYREIENNSLDFVLIDGVSRSRCAVNSIHLLKSNGILMLDDSQSKKHYTSIAKLLKNLNWKEHTTSERHLSDRSIKDVRKSQRVLLKKKTTWWVKP